VDFHKLRQSRLLSRRKLEEASGVYYITIWRLETNRTEAHPRTIRRIAKALNVVKSDCRTKGRGAVKSPRVLTVIT
jgi:transcriptional regulator with XRE-family HTH domain